MFQGFCALCTHPREYTHPRCTYLLEGGLGAGPWAYEEGFSLQGHLNWPPFCPVILNVTHLAHQVTTDRFNRKVSASKRQPAG